uniref:OSJNBa0061C06.3 protein n=1 Tax=Oryza sativa subsp. japonica TaxID=39947 RepID=Q5JQV9_ORYSJ|nr:OSJNBa0061C06.3 [Oryza sativa Japonica Group]
MTAPPLVVHEEDEVAGELHEEDGSGGGAQEEEVQVRLRLSSMPATVEHPSLPRGTKFVIIEHPSLPRRVGGGLAAHSGADEERKGRESCRSLLAAGAAWATPLDRSGRFAGAVAA